MMRREMRARRRLGANSRSTDVVVTPWADEYVPAPCADLPTYPPCHAGAGGRTYLPTPPLISEVGLPTMKKHKTQALGGRSAVCALQQPELSNAMLEVRE